MIVTKQVNQLHELSSDTEKLGTELLGVAEFLDEGSQTAASSDETAAPSVGDTGETPSVDSSDEQGVHAYKY